MTNKNIKMNRIISKFREYLKSKNKEENKNYNISLNFIDKEYQSEFKNFVKKEFGNKSYASIFVNGINIKKQESASISNQKENATSDKNNLIEMIGDLVGKDECLNIFDLDEDSSISEEEFAYVASSLDSDSNENLSFEEVINMVNSVNDGSYQKISKDDYLEFLSSLNSNNENGTTETISPESGTSGLLNNNGSGNQQYNTTPLDNLNSMTIEELQQELTTKKEETENANKELNSIINEESSALADQKATMESSFEAFEKELENKNKELSQNIKTQKNTVDNLKTNKNNTEANINTAKLNISNLTAQKTNIDNTVNALSAQISSLEAQKTSLSGKNDDDDNSTKTKIAEIEAQIAAAKAELEAQKTNSEAKQTEINTENSRLESLTGSLGQIEAQLSTETTKLSEFEKQAAELANAKNGNTDANPELKKAYEAYMKAKDKFEQDKTRLTAEAKNEVEKTKSAQDKIQEKINQKEAISTKNKYSVNGLEGTYKFKDGEEYDIVNINLDLDGDGISDVNSLEEFQSIIQKAGLTNTGDFGTKQCFNYSQVYCKLMMGIESEAIVNAIKNPSFKHQAGKLAKSFDKINGYNNQRSLMNTRTESETFSKYDIIASELAQGRACVVGIPRVSAGYSTHYGIACGIKKGAKPPFNASDFLIIDSYDGNIEKGSVTNSFNEKRELFTYNPSNPGYHYKDRDGVYRNYSDKEIEEILKKYYS